MVRQQSNIQSDRKPRHADNPAYAFGEEARVRSKAAEPDASRSLRYTRTVSPGSVAVHHIFHTDDRRKVTLYIMQGITDRGFFAKVEVRSPEGKRAGSYITLRPDHASVDQPPSDDELEAFGHDYRAISISRLLAVLIDDVGIVSEDALLIAGKLSAALEYELGKL